MEPSREASQPPWLPARREPGPVPAVPDQPPAESQPAEPPPPPGPRFGWRRVTRSPRGAAGLAIGVAALLLWPFSGWSAIPWLAGVGLLLLLRLLRLDGLLRGWALHLGGLAVVGGLMLSTDPWAWALAASVGVLLAGLAQLPWWRLAAVGAALCVVSGVGFGFATAREARLVESARAQTSLRNQGQIAEEADRILPALVQSITDRQPDPELLCVLLTPAAEAALAKGVGVDDCRAAGVLLYERLQGRAPLPPATRPRPPARGEPPPQRLVLDGCGTSWAAAAGPALGRIQIELFDPDQRTYLVAGFLSCQGVTQYGGTGP